MTQNRKKIRNRITRSKVTDVGVERTYQHLWGYSWTIWRPYSISKPLAMNSGFGFYDELIHRLNENGEMMTAMPLTALIGTRILCMHGGISPRIETLEDLKNCRPVNGDPREDCLEMDLMWSDPSDDHEGCRPSERGGNAFIFGPDVVEEVLDKLYIRAHQVVRNGYEFHAGRKCVTVFSGQFGGCLRCLRRIGNHICATHSRDPSNI